MQKLMTDEAETVTTPTFKKGDLVRTSKLLSIRVDGFTFCEDDVDEEGNIPKSWVRGADVLHEGSLCLFVSLAAHDPTYALVRRDLVGRWMTVRLSVLELVAGINDAVEFDATAESDKDDSDGST